MARVTPLSCALPLAPPGATRDEEVIDAITSTLLKADGGVVAGLSLITGAPSSGRSTALMLALKDLAHPRPFYVRIMPQESKEDILHLMTRTLRAELMDGERSVEAPNETDLRAMILDVIASCEALEEAPVVIVDAPWQTAPLWSLCDLVARYALRSAWIVVLDRVHFSYVHHRRVDVPPPTARERYVWLEGVTPQWTKSQREEFLEAHHEGGFARLVEQLESLHSPCRDLTPGQARIVHDVRALSDPVHALWMDDTTIQRELLELESLGVVHKHHASLWRVTTSAQSRSGEQESVAHDASQRSPIKERLAACHESSPSPAARAVASFGLFELAHTRGDLEEANELLEAERHQWLDAELAHDLWARLMERASLAQPRDAMYILECALRTQDADHLNAVRRPSLEDIEATMLWIGVLAERGEAAQAFEVFTSYRGRFDEVEAWMLELQLLLSMARFSELLKRATDRELEAHLSLGRRLCRDGLVVLALTWEGRREEALEHAGALRQELLSCHAEGCLERDMPAHYAWLNLARAYHLCHQTHLARESHAFVGSIHQSKGDLIVWFYDKGSVDYLEALLLVDALELDQAEGVLSTLMERFSPAHTLGFHVRQLYAVIAYCREDHETFRVRYDTLHRASFQKLQDWDFIHLFQAHGSWLQHGSAQCEPIDMEQGDVRASRKVVFNLKLAYDRGESTAQLRASYQAIHPPDAARMNDPELRLLEILSEQDVSSSSRMLQELEGACLRLYQRHKDAGNVRGALTHERVRAWTCMCLGASARAAQAWREIATWAMRTRNASLLQRATTLSAWLDRPPHPLDVALLAALNPPSSLGRIVEGVLGGETPSLLEGALVNALHDHFGWRIRRRTDHTRGDMLLELESLDVLYVTPHAGEASHVIELPKRGVQHKLLGCLVSRFGKKPCTKEELLRDVWGIESHHPLKHENRLRMAIFKLRKLVKDIAPEDAFITTTPSGEYALGDGVMLIERAKRHRESAV